MAVCSGGGEALAILTKFEVRGLMGRDLVEVFLAHRPSDSLGLLAVRAVGTGLRDARSQQHVCYQTSPVDFVDISSSRIFRAAEGVGTNYSSRSSVFIFDQIVSDSASGSAFETLIVLSK